MKCNTMKAPLFWFPLLQAFELSHERWGRLLCYSLLLLDYQRLKPERACHHAVHWIAQRPNVEDSVASCGEKTHGKQMNIHISLLCAACGNDATHPSFSSPTTNCNHVCRVTLPEGGVQSPRRLREQFSLVGRPHQEETPVLFILVSAATLLLTFFVRELWRKRASFFQCKVQKTKNIFSKLCCIQEIV